MLLKRLYIAIFLFFCAATAFAGNISEIVFFGDSLSDNGKLYQFLFHVLPKSPPYFNGRFSNGPTWAEDVAKYYYDKSYMPSANYALGGASAVFHIPKTTYMPTTTMEVEIDTYLLKNVFHSKSNVLYIIWIGANDYLYADGNEFDARTEKVVNTIDWAMRRLKYSGAKNFFVINLPDLSRIPFARENNIESQLKSFTILHNIKLQNVIDSFKQDYPEAAVYTMDAYTRLNNLLDHPEIYNKKYNINITNTTTSCWPGGFTLRQLATQPLAESIKQTYMKLHGSLPAGFDAEAASKYIASSPELAYTYALGQTFALGNVPCVNANEHVFWDGMHPTEVVHQIFASVIEETLKDAI